MEQIDLDGMQLDELRKLRRRVDAAIDSFEARRKDAARRELEELARSRGFSSLAELVEPAPAKRRKSAPTGAAKYRHPENPALTWSGRGRRPGWVVEALAAGRSLEGLRIG
ncbi:MAG: H-NS histone family protein [Rhodobacteraceae bacterium]|jgi:DNA-binding protein H-NS|nr:H-NS histone family protein [Paracoccaceae bacterium]